MTKQNKMFYGWIIAAVALLSLIVSNGLSLLGIPVFYKFVQTDLVNAGAVAPDKIQTVYGLAPALTSLLSGFFSPVGGFLLQKFNVRAMMIAGCLILGSGLIVYSQANAPVWVYLAHALMGISLGFVGVLVSAVLISNWFQKKRGLALGIVLTGTSFGGVLIPQLATPLIQNYGWRTAMILTSLIIWIVLLPAVIFFVKNRPEDLGLFPDGASEIRNQESGIRNQESEIGLSLPEALAAGRFWVFSLCAALIFYAILVVSQQLNLYLQSPKLGFTPAQAGFVQSLIFAFSVIGKFTFGWLADRFPVNRVMLFSAATMFLATTLFLVFNSLTVYLFAALFGLNYGGTFVLLQLLVAEYFGLKEYGKILGALFVIETIGGGLGTLVSGKIADANGGDYTQSFYGVTAAAAFALLAVIYLNFSSDKFRRPVRILPVLMIPLIGIGSGLIVGPVLSEVIKVITGAEISLLIPLIIIFSLAGLILGGLAARRLKTAENYAPAGV